MSDESASNTARTIRRALIIAGVQVVGALLLTLARKQGLIDQDLMTRGVMILIGLGVAAYGNTMPKMMEGPAPTTIALAAVRQAISRFGGWAMMLGGLAYAGFWAFAPRDLALVGSVISVALAVVLMVAYTGWRMMALRRAPTP